MAYNNPYQVYGNQYQPYINPYQPYQYPTALPQMQQPMQQTSYQVRPVTSHEEALGTQADFFGPGTIMPDLAHEFVYLKRFNQDTGASDLLKFKQVKTETTDTPESDLEELKAAVRRLQEEIEKLKTNKAKVVKKNDDE